MTTGIVFECGWRRAVVEGATVSIYRLTDKKKAHKPLWRDTLDDHAKAMRAAKQYAFEGKMGAFIKLLDVVARGRKNSLVPTKSHNY